MSDSIVKEINKVFNEKFGVPDCIVRSPGRINLIGEHTDYNLGYVLPAAIDKAIFIAIRKRQDVLVHLYAGDLRESFESSITQLEKSEHQWPNYILGVADQLIKSKFFLSGFDAVIMGDVPLGAGLSSSAAVECCTIFALNHLFQLGLDRKRMALLCQKAENDFVGLQCGIMDMFASMFGKKDRVIQLDCRSLAYHYIPFETSGISLVLFDTGVKHSLASTAYNVRRQECENGVALIQKKYPHVSSLRDANIEMIIECLAAEDQKIFRRCKYIVQEIDRLEKGCADLVNGDMAAFGKKMFDTHEGLSQLYEVSCTEADALVSMVSANPGVVGARMMGGGFGGCTLNLVYSEALESTLASVGQAFEKLFSRELKYYLVKIDEGTSIVG